MKINSLFLIIWPIIPSGFFGYRFFQIQTQMVGAFQYKNAMETQVYKVHLFTLIYLEDK